MVADGKEDFELYTKLAEQNKKELSYERSEQIDKLKKNQLKIIEKNQRKQLNPLLTSTRFWLVVILVLLLIIYFMVVQSAY